MITHGPIDYGHLAQKAAEEHLAACMNALYAEEEGQDWTEDDDELDLGAEWPDTAGPFCGCEICVVRETLHAAWPILLKAAKAEVLAELAEAVPV